MTRVALVTDSTANLPAELVDQYHIHVIPLNLMFGDKTYRDNVDISVDEFYERLAAVKDNLPAPSQPSAGAFLDVYKQVAQEADTIVSIHISGALSGTVDSALQAKALLPDVAIHVVDTRLTSMAQGYLVLAAARALEAGATAAEAAAAAQALVPATRLYFAVDTLRYLHMGGRIGGGSVLLGTALDIKPILELTGGKIEAAGKARSMKRAILRLAEIMVGHFGEGSRVRVATVGAACPESAEALGSRLRQHFDCVEFYATDLSPAIGTHVGPGTIGAVVCPA
jgi:DegV family protein with EDD domain